MEIDWGDDLFTYTVLQVDEHFLCNASVMEVVMEAAYII